MEWYTIGVLYGQLKAKLKGYSRITKSKTVWIQSSLGSSEIVRNLGGCVREESFDVVVIDLYSFRV